MRVKVMTGVWISLTFPDILCHFCHFLVSSLAPDQNGYSLCAGVTCARVMWGKSAMAPLDESFAALGLRAWGWLSLMVWRCHEAWQVASVSICGRVARGETGRRYGEPGLKGATDHNPENYPYWNAIVIRDESFSWSSLVADGTAGFLADIYGNMAIISAKFHLDEQEAPEWTFTSASGRG